MLPKINLEHLELFRPWGPQIQLHEGPGQVYTKLTLTHSVTMMQLT